MVSHLASEVIPCAHHSDDIVDSLFTYTCDVSNYKEVEEVADRIRKEVSSYLQLI